MDRKYPFFLDNTNVRMLIREKAYRVWQDDAVVCEHERFFVEALKKLA